MSARYINIKPWLMNSWRYGLPSPKDERRTFILNKCNKKGKKK